MLDNASNNDVCVRELAERFNFDPKHRRLRCVGHILNLVVREALFGSEVNVLKAELAARKDLLDELTLWRRRGPIGRLYNLVVWIYKSPQRKIRFYEAQREFRALLETEDNAAGLVILDLVQDNSTRWNSTYKMIDRAVKLRLAIEFFIDTEQVRYEGMVRKGNKPKDPGAPSLVIFEDRLAADDWDVLNRYMKLLAPLEELTKELEGRPETGY